MQFPVSKANPIFQYYVVIELQYSKPYCDINFQRWGSLDKVSRTVILNIDIEKMLQFVLINAWLYPKGA